MISVVLHATVQLQALLTVSGGGAEGRRGLTWRAFGGSEDRRGCGQVIKGLDIKEQVQVFSAVGGTPGGL